MTKWRLRGSSFTTGAAPGMLRELSRPAYADSADMGLSGAAQDDVNGRLDPRIESRKVTALPKSHSGAAIRSPFCAN